MSPSEVVTEFIRAIERTALDDAVAMTSADISYENMPIDPIVGHDALRSMLHMFVDPATSLDWQILAQYEIGGVVVNERLDRFEFTTGWLELPVAGFFRVDDQGLITLWRDYFDMASYQRQVTDLTG
jgi:limonene-1,2-epoxide hydrolase